jgi:hypothetical protein
MLTNQDTITIVDATKYPRSVFESIIYNGKGNQQHDLDVRIRHLISLGDDEFLHSASATVRMDLHAFAALELTASVCGILKYVKNVSYDDRNTLYVSGTFKEWRDFIRGHKRAAMRWKWEICLVLVDLLREHCDSAFVDLAMG